MTQTQTERIVVTFSRADFPEALKLRAACAEPGCSEMCERWTPDVRTLPNTIAYLRGYFQDHILNTGHSIVVVEAVEGK